jgi:hypothetical protein
MGPNLTPAEGFILGVGAKMFPVAVPDICLRRRRSLASVDRCHSSSATGGAPIAPHRRSGDRLWRIRQRGVWSDLLDNHIILSVGEWAALVAWIDFFVALSYNKLEGGLPVAFS